MTQLTFDSSFDEIKRAAVAYAVQEAKLLVSVAIGKTNPNGVWDNPDHKFMTNYLEYFGTYDQSRALFVHRTYRFIKQALEGQIEFIGSAKGESYASAFPGLKCKIRLFPAFWTSQPRKKGKKRWMSRELGVRSSIQSRPGTIIHELAHETLRGGDFKYGEDGTKRLTLFSPWLAIRNAENYQLFAESI